MRSSALLVWFASLVAAALGLIVTADTDGCAVAPHRGDEVSIADESAIIVWDAATKTEHFIRRATFNVRAADFGFLVPTPAQPALAEAADTAFTYVQDMTRPQIVETSGGVDFAPLFCCMRPGAMPTKSAKAPGGVEVLDARRVGGFDAVVLQADDAHALTDWLKEHRYSADPALVSWFAPYIAGKWKITAFKIAPGARTRAVRTTAVRMSFRTDRPYFPYREPQPSGTDKAAQSYRPRLLRVSFIGTARAAGTLGNAVWQAGIPWADKLSDAQRRELIEQLGVPSEHLAPGAWLTTFVDTASPRPGTDEVFFADAPEQTVVYPPPIRRRTPPIPLPLDAVLLVLLAVGLFFFALYRYGRRARSRPLDTDGAV